MAFTLVISIRNVTHRTLRMVKQLLEMQDTGIRLALGITIPATKKPTTFYKISQLDRLLRIGRQNHQLTRPVGIIHPKRVKER